MFMFIGVETGVSFLILLYQIKSYPYRIVILLNPTAKSNLVINWGTDVFYVNYFKSMCLLTCFEVVWRRRSEVIISK